MVAAVPLASCRAARSAIPVGVVFANTWTFDGSPLDASEIAVVKTRTLDTLNRAYAGFGVAFDQTARPTHLIRVEDSSFAATPVQRMSFGAVGATFPMSSVSAVRFDVLAKIVLDVSECEHAAPCAVPRRELLDGLGRGVGATAAHELGHQRGFGFATDSDCDDCYDGRSSTTRVHFFGEKHWSDSALQAMRRVLPRR